MSGGPVITGAQLAAQQAADAAAKANPGAWRVHEGRAEGWGEAEQPTERITVPPAFIEDWLACWCQLDPVRTRRKGRRIEAEVSARDRADLLSRARHYAENAEYGAGLCSSARATVKALTA